MIDSESRGILPSSGLWTANLCATWRRSVMRECSWTLTGETMQASHAHCMTGDEASAVVMLLTSLNASCMQPRHCRMGQEED